MRLEPKSYKDSNEHCVTVAWLYLDVQELQVALQRLELCVHVRLALL